MSVEPPTTSDPTYRTKALHEGGRIPMISNGFEKHHPSNGHSKEESNQEAKAFLVALPPGEANKLMKTFSGRTGESPDQVVYHVGDQRDRGASLRILRIPRERRYEASA